MAFPDADACGSDAPYVRHHGGVRREPTWRPPAAAGGYCHPRYAASLAAWGTPRRLARAGGWLLVRPIPGAGADDACGPYPLLACRDWRALPDDLRTIGRELVSVTAVTDPFGPTDASVLRGAFPDLVRPFKEHFVVDLTRPPATSSHHRRNARRARAAVAVERLDDPPRHAAEWCRLYATLVRRHAIGGVAAFSPAALAAQLEVPGLVAYRAREGTRTVGMALWFVQGDVAYYHLAAYAERGYALGASFALFDAALRELRGVVAWASLGGAAGARPVPGDGLARFKAGWATGTRTAWLCGRILAPDRYATLAAARGAPADGWFPAYRHGEAP